MPNEAVLTSMQFFASAQLEESQMAKFIMLVTALEALSVQHDLGAAVDAVLARCAAAVRDAPELAGSENARQRESLAGRVRAIKRDSVRQTIKRCIQEHIADPAVWAFVDQAYGLRSEMLHDGQRPVDLSERIAGLEQVLRTIYANITKLPLAR